MYFFNGFENNFRRWLQLFLLLQLVRKNIQQHFRIGRRVDMTQIFTVNIFRQLFGIGQITVMRQRNSVR